MENRQECVPGWNHEKRSVRNHGSVITLKEMEKMEWTYKLLSKWCNYYFCNCPIRDFILRNMKIGGGLRRKYIRKKGKNKLQDRVCKELQREIIVERKSRRMHMYSEY